MGSLHNSEITKTLDKDIESEKQESEKQDSDKNITVYFNSKQGGDLDEEINILDKINNNGEFFDNDSEDANEERVDKKKKVVYSSNEDKVNIKKDEKDLKSNQHLKQDSKNEKNSNDLSIKIDKSNQDSNDIKEKNNKTLIIGILSIVALILTAGIGYYLYNSSQNQNSNDYYRDDYLYKRVSVTDNNLNYNNLNKSI